MVKINKYQTAIIYQLIVDKIGQINRKTPPKYADALQELELIFSNEYDRMVKI